VRRRAFLWGSTATLSAPLAGEAQHGKMWRVGYLSMGSAEIDRAWVAAFRRELHELGYVEGRTIIVEQRHADGRIDALPDLAAQLVSLNIVVVVVWGDRAVVAVKEASSSLPIVMAVHPDPVGAGLANSLARPGGRVTGLSDYHGDTVTKRLELLKQIVPSASRVGVFLNPTYPPAVRQLRDIKAAAPLLGVTAFPIEAKGDEEIERAFSALSIPRPGALLIIPDPGFTARTKIAELAIKSRLATVSTVRQWADAGILMSYGANFVELWRRSATYVDKILKGAKPGDLPIEQPTQFELTINLKTAKALGLTIPPSILARADQVIE
jgi:putative tryptophan/tyrosine transport system substrate-binding protein